VRHRQAIDVEGAEEPVPFPLSEAGPDYTGKRTFTFEDASRGCREIGVTVYYPAPLLEGSKGDKLLAGTNRDPDLRTCCAGGRWILKESSLRQAERCGAYPSKARLPPSGTVLPAWTSCSSSCTARRAP
jgi:hypothetical protein